MRRETNPCASEVFQGLAKFPQISARMLPTGSHCESKTPIEACRLRPGLIALGVSSDGGPTGEGYGLTVNRALTLRNWTPTQTWRRRPVRNPAPNVESALGGIKRAACVENHFYFR
jgi:hypothetical protein